MIYQDPAVPLIGEEADDPLFAEFSLERRLTGKDWPRYAHTMIGARRLDNVRGLIENVLQKGVPGDLIETGVWRGGSTIFMRGVLKAHGITDRTVWVADSFEGYYPGAQRARDHREVLHVSGSGAAGAEGRPATRRWSRTSSCC